MTAIFNLYRLNWWPRRVGGRLSYFSFWSAALAVGWAAHEVDLVDRLRRWLGRDGARGENDWERKSASPRRRLVHVLSCRKKRRR